MTPQTAVMDRVPPYNTEAERSVLGACLLDRDALISVTEMLQPDDFYDPRHRTAFEVIMGMAQRGQAVDSLTFKDEVARQGLEERLGGTAFIAALMDAVTTTANAEYHAGIVRDKSIHRSLITVGTEITKMGFSEDLGVDEILEKSEQKVFDIARSGSSASIKPARTFVQDAFNEMEARLVGGKGMTGIPTGFTDFDKLSGGMQPGGLYILAARPSMGKTALALNIADYAALQGNFPVLIFSLEMSSGQIAERMIASESRVNLRQMLSTQNVDKEQWNEVTRAARMLKASPIFIDDSSVLTTMDLRGRCRRFFAKHQPKADPADPNGTPIPGLVVLDYLQLMDVANKSDSRQQDVSEISRALKGIAREFGVPVLALSQLSRDVEKRGGSKKPQLSDLRDSGAIEQDADMVMFIYREAYYAQEGEAADPTSEVIVAKHRNGPTGSVELVFFKEYARFENRIGSGF